MKFDYKASKKRVEEILNSTKEVEEREKLTSDIGASTYTYSNGFRSWVGAIFVDMRDSSAYFTENTDTLVAKIMRAFISEIITILDDGDNALDIGIRGDCVYGIYSAPKKADLHDIYLKAAWINTFQNAFQKILKKRNYPTFSIGIGLGAGKDLVVKAGKPRTGINDWLWIGDAVINASNLSSIGDNEFGYPIYADSTFFGNIAKFEAANGKTVGDLFSKDVHENQTVYKGDIIITEYDRWITNDFQDE